MPQEKVAGRIVCFVCPCISQPIERRLEPAAIVGGHLNSHKDPAIVGPVAAIVEKADIPPRPDRFQKIEEAA